MREEKTERYVLNGDVFKIIYDKEECQWLAVEEECERLNALTTRAEQAEALLSDDSISHYEEPTPNAKTREWSDYFNTYLRGNVHVHMVFTVEEWEHIEHLKKEHKP